jgi:nucleotide-binding universal stress UspA family protein
MYKNIAVAYDESPEAGRALIAAIGLANCLGARLHTITVMANLPVYTAFATGADPALLVTLDEDRHQFYDRLQTAARTTAKCDEIELQTHLMDGEPVDGIVGFVCQNKIDLLVIGLHRRPNRVSSLWSTVYTIAQNVPCSVLGVH